jgi:ribonuclease R
MKGQQKSHKEGAESAALLAHLRRPGYKPVPQRRLLHQMHVPGDRRPLFREAIRGLIERGVILKQRGGKLVLRRGGKVQRGRRSVLGLFRRVGNGGEVRAFDPLVPHAVRIPASFRMGAEDDHVVSVEILRGPGRDGGPEGKVLEQLGRFDEPGMDLRIVARRYGLRTGYPAAVREAAERLPSRPGTKAKAGRTRFDDPAPVTIDGETAQDFDDAVAVVERSGGRFRLWVHIADVAHFVREGDPLDREAQRRGTSVYFPGHVLPMFPEKLSNDLCSLRPGVERLVHSVIIDVAAGGEIEKVRFADGLIRSAARLTYSQVAQALDGGGRVKGVPAGVAPMLVAADRLRRVLEERRRKRGSVDCDLPEPTILLDVAGEMTGIRIEPRNRAHRMIEEFMLLANEAVAGYVEKRLGHCVYRVHDSPDAAKLEVLSRFVAGFGLRLDQRGGSSSPKQIQRLLEQAAGRPESTLISQVVLRSMKRASYTTENVGHFGLAMKTYTHFTSPIRRYPDLLVHRLLRQARAGERDGGRSVEHLEALARECSDLERNAEAAERELLAWKKVAFIADRVGEKFRGVITGVARFGLFVQLEESLAEGLLKVELLGNERFDYSDARQELRGSRSGRAYRLGDRLEVRVDRVDTVLKRVDFSLAGRPAKGQSRRRAGTAGRRGRRGGRSRGVV